MPCNHNGNNSTETVREGKKTVVYKVCGSCGARRQICRS